MSPINSYTIRKNGIGGQGKINELPSNKLSGFPLQRVGINLHRRQFSQFQRYMISTLSALRTAGISYLCDHLSLPTTIGMSGKYLKVGIHPPYLYGGFLAIK